MTRDPLDAEDLRARFLSPPPGAGEGENCPEPERYLALAQGELAPEENRVLADHAATCPACTVSWRLARDYAGEAARRARPAVAAGVARRWLGIAAAAAALVLVAFLIPWSGREEPPPPAMRSAPDELLRSLLPEDRPLRNDAVVLRWTPGPAGGRYDVRVTDRRLTHLAGARALEDPEYAVPPSALVGLGAGDPILWQVEAVLPDGRRIVSETFVVHLADSPP